MSHEEIIDNQKEVLEIYFSLIEELGSISPDAGIVAASIIHQTIKKEFYEKLKRNKNRKI